MKTYTGIELLQAKMKGEIKEEQKLKDSSGNVYTATNTVDYFVDEYNAPISEGFDSLDEFLLTEFTLIEEPEEIDIQAIEELSEGKGLRYLGGSLIVEENIKSIINSQNKLIRVIKQLDRQLNNR